MGRSEEVIIASAHGRNHGINEFNALEGEEVPTGNDESRGPSFPRRLVTAPFFAANCAPENTASILWHSLLS